MRPLSCENTALLCDPPAQAQQVQRSITGDRKVTQQDQSMTTINHNLTTMNNKLQELIRITITEDHNISRGENNKARGDHKTARRDRKLTRTHIF